MHEGIDHIGSLETGESVVVDWSNTNVAYHLLETPNLLSLVKEVLPTIHPNGVQQSVTEHDMGRVVGTTLHVPITEEDDIVYARRVGRTTYSKFALHRSPLPTTCIVVVLRKLDDATYSLWTAMAGRKLPRDAYDPTSEFSKTHALAFDQSLVELASVRRDDPTQQ